MIAQTVILDDARWTCRVMYEAGKDCINAVESLLRQMGASSSVIDRARVVLSGPGNEGLTYSNAQERCSLVVITRTSDAAQFADSYAHEISHVIAHISHTDGIDALGEEGQYLYGELVHKTFRVARRFLCDCCRRKTNNNNSNSNER